MDNKWDKMNNQKQPTQHKIKLADFLEIECNYVYLKSIKVWQKGGQEFPASFYADQYAKRKGHNKSNLFVSRRLWNKKSNQKRLLVL